MQTTELTPEYRVFIEMYANDNSNVIQESSEGYQITLENGQLCIIGTDNIEIWHSNNEWYVDSFKTGDVNCDSILDVAFIVWKSYSFGNEHPSRMTNEDSSVRCHLFVYSVKDNKIKPLWCSSNLPRPVYSFELNADGEQTPVLSGVRLITQEGVYTEDYSKTTSNEYIYEWSGWGFSPVNINIE